MTPPAVADGLQLALWATLNPPYPVTNIPNTYSPRWRPWFSAEKEPLFGTGKQLCRIRA